MTETMTQVETSQNQNGSTGFLDNEPIAPKRKGRQPGSVSKNAQTETLKRIESGFSSMLQGAGALMMAGGGKLGADGQAIIMGEPRLTASVVELCRQDKRVREFMLSLTTGSAYANVAIATMPIVIAILANHNLLPPIFGIALPQQPASPNVSQNGSGYAVPSVAEL